MKPAAYWLGFMLLFAAACRKETGTLLAPPAKLSYGDSIFHVKNADYTIAPTITRTGTYSAFPDNLRINQETGEITVSMKGKDGENDQTGLRYRVTFLSPEGARDTTYIVLGGVTYQDKIYSLAQDETVATAIYNANISSPLTTTGGTFSSSDKKLAIDPNTGAIDLKKSIQNSLFHNDPRDADWEVVTINYKTNNQGTITNNKLDVVVYYYSSLNNIPSNVSAVMRAHQDQLVGIQPVSIPVTHAPVDNEIDNIVSASRPRPPCIVIIGRVQ